MRVVPAFISACLAISAATQAPAAPFAYITNQGSNDVSAIDVATNAVVATIPAGAQPFGVATNFFGTRVYTANIGDNTTSVVDATTNTALRNR